MSDRSLLPVGKLDTDCKVFRSFALSLQGHLFSTFYMLEYLNLQSVSFLCNLFARSGATGWNIVNTLTAKFSCRFAFS